MPLVNPQPSPSSTQDPQPPSFAECPFSSFTATSPEDTWYEIALPRSVPNFDICPTCYETSIKPTHYSRFIAPSAPKFEDTAVRCDFSDLWIRIAFSWLVTQKAPDLDLLGKLSALLVGSAEDGEGICPNLDLENELVKSGGEKPETRTWYSLSDPEKPGRLVEEMTVCSDCVSHLYTIAPCLVNIFVPAASGQKVLATCDLMMLGHGKERCLSYLDAFLNIARETLKTGVKDIKPLTQYIKKWAPVPFCMKNEKVAGKKCWKMDRVSEWTCCEECYLNHVEELVSITSSLQHAALTSSIPPTGFTCQMYSPRLQAYFQTFAATNDAATIRQKLTARNSKLEEMRREVKAMQIEYQNLKTQADWHWQVMLMEQASAQTTSLAWGIGGGWGGPTDYRATNAHMNKGGELAMQADIVMSKMQMTENEWAEHWE